MTHRSRENKSENKAEGQWGFVSAGIIRVRVRVPAPPSLTPERSRGPKRPLRANREVEAA